MGKRPKKWDILNSGMRIIGLLIALGFLATAIALLFLPDTVPAHYNWAGEIDRYGSKYEYLLFPVISAAFGCGYGCGASASKDRATSKVLYYTAIFGVLFFQIMGFYYIGKGSTFEPLSAGSFDGAKITALATGLLLIVLGNLMPKAKKNAVFGLRTKWSMASDELWRKSQRFGGFASVTAGIVLVVLGLLLDGMRSLAALLAVLIIWTAVCFAASRRYWQRENASH